MDLRNVAAEDHSLVLDAVIQPLTAPSASNVQRTSSSMLYLLSAQKQERWPADPVFHREGCAMVRRNRDAVLGMSRVPRPVMPTWYALMADSLSSPTGAEMRRLQEIYRTFIKRTLAAASTALRRMPSEIG